jgi:hypothetical protein
VITVHELGPEQPDGPKPSSASSDPGEWPASYEAVEDQIRLVIAWYAQEMRAEETAEVPDLVRLERLETEWQACIADQEALETAGPEQVERLAATYAERYRRIIADQ